MKAITSINRKAFDQGKKQQSVIFCQNFDLRDYLHLKSTSVVVLKSIFMHYFKRKWQFQGVAAPCHVTGTLTDDPIPKTAIVHTSPSYCVQMEMEGSQTLENVLFGIRYVHQWENWENNSMKQSKNENFCRLVVKSLHSMNRSMFLKLPELLLTFVVHL